MSDDARSRFVHRYSCANSGEIDAEFPTRRHGDADQADWEMLFLSRLTVLLSTRLFDAGEYEISELTWSDSYLRLVVEVWHRERSAVVGWHVHLPTLRRSFDPSEPGTVATAWWTGGFMPCYLSVPYEPGPDGIHWRGTEPR